MPHLCSARLIVDRARHLIGQHAFLLINEGRTQTLELWQRCLPHLIVEQNAWLLYWLGLCRLPFSTAESRIYFEKAFNIFEAEENITGLYLAWAGISNTIQYEWDNFTSLDKWIGKLEGLHCRYPTFPSIEIEIRVSAGMLSNLMYRQPDHPSIGKWAEHLDALLQRSP